LLLSSVAGGDAIVQALPGAFGSELVVTQVASSRDFPDSALSLTGLSAVMVDDFDTAALNTTQVRALTDFVALGGTLVLGGGAAAARSVTPLPRELAPLRPSGTAQAPLSILADLGGATSQATATVSIGELTAGRTALQAKDGPPLVVEADHGAGHIVQLAYDPFAEPIASDSVLWTIGWEQALARGLSRWSRFGSIPTAAPEDQVWSPVLDRPTWPSWPGRVVALVAAFVPAVIAVVALVAVALVLASVLTGGVANAGRAVLAAAGATVVAAVLLFPWSVDFVLPGTQLSSVLGLSRSAAAGPGLGQLLRFEIGPLGAPPIGWAFLLAAALPLLVGRGWRLAWAWRMWVVALVCWGVAWTGGRGWLPIEVGAPDVLLAPAAVAMAMAVALGMVAFETDLPGYRFGWRQLASTTALVPVGVTILMSAVSPVVPGGLWAVILVSESTVKLAAGRAPKLTAVAPARLLPVMVTTVPPPVGPDVGAMAVTVGTPA